VYVSTRQDVAGSISTNNYVHESVCIGCFLCMGCVVTRMDRNRNEYIRGILKVAPVTDTMRSNRLAWYG
jgi:hypothetical protein